MNWLAHLLLPSSIWGWLGYTTFFALAGVAVFLAFTGGGKIVSTIAELFGAAAKPVATEAGALIAEGADVGVHGFARGLTVIAANPIVLWPLVVFVAIGVTWGTNHFTSKSTAALHTAKAETKATNARLAQCLAAKASSASSRKTIARKPAAAPRGFSVFGN